MADEFDKYASEQRFRARKLRIDEFYRYLNFTYNSVSKIPASFDEEADQKRYIINELLVLEQRMDTFRNDLRS